MGKLLRDGEETTRVVLGSGADTCLTHQTLTLKAMVATHMLFRAAGCEAR